jgi:hypothetical protein
MITYSNYKLPPGLEYVGDGFTIRKTVECSKKETIQFMQALCQHLIAHPDPMIVPVYSFEYLGEKASHTYSYSYDMMRLGDLTDEERKIIWEVTRAKGSWPGAGNCGAPSKDPLRIFREDAKITSEQAWQDYPKLMAYLGEVIKQSRYHDMHEENILMDEEANYRIIDLEGFLNLPLSLSENDWIRGT